MYPRDSWLIVGLGNPGERYHLTRHNLGFWVLDLLATESNVHSWMNRGGDHVANIRIGNSTVRLLKPQTWMNLSGAAVLRATEQEDLDYDHMVVVCDDVALPDGRLRLRSKGSSGGHRGLESIIQSMGHETFPRLRIGVGGDREMDDDLSDYVLEQLHDHEISMYMDAVQRAVCAIRLTITDGLSKAMTVYNQAVGDDSEDCAGIDMVQSAGGAE